MDSKLEKISHRGILVPVIVKSREGKTKPGKVYVQNWNKKQRLERSLKILGMGWGLAVASIFLPIAHFILVPAFLIGSPIAAIYASRQQSAILGGESICPHCGKDLPLERGAEVWPLEDLCAACQTHLLIEKATN